MGSVRLIAERFAPIARHVVPVHFEDWAHFTEGRETLEPAFAAAGLAERLHLLDRCSWWNLEAGG